MEIVAIGLRNRGRRCEKPSEWSVGGGKQSPLLFWDTVMYMYMFTPYKRARHDESYNMTMTIESFQSSSI
jgi:hypothetical protein